MSAILEIDKYQRKIISVIFRFIIIGYSVFLLLYCNSIFKWYFNIGAFILYLVMYFVLYKRDKIISLLRLLNDYVFISFILYQTQEIGIYSFALLFAPILNTHNHSGEKKSILLYIFPLLSLFIVTKDFELWYSVPFFLFLLINTFDSLRTKYFRFQQKLNSVIDDFFTSEELINRPYRIYEKAIPILNASNTLRHNISNIICLKIEKNRFSIVNGSSFIWDFDIIDKKVFFENIKDKKTLFNVKLSLDNKEINNNIVIVCPVNSHPFCFILLSENLENFNQFPYSLFISKLLNPFFYRLSKVLDADLRKKKNELIKLTELEEKINYVTNSVNSMHFIRNKLGPVKSYLAMIEDYNRTSDPLKKLKIEPFLVKERQKLNTSIFQILERAEYILTKSNNPFNVYKTELHGLQQLFSEVRRIWSYFFDVDNFDLGWIVSKDRIKCDVRYNHVGIELVLTNWISNMSKYNSGDYGIEFTETDEYYNVILYNSIDCSFPNSTKFVDEFNTSDRAEITRRNSRGLLEVKDFLTQMDISEEMYIRDSIVYFSLGFKKYLYDESTNN